ncbi:MAG TPA: hypothetical protein VK700_21110 [Steroidobacteraceae bacterium]|jgi:hypothetical protein|nr:hypothetical protein [Steroidobacteraceae bacterium]
MKPTLPSLALACCFAALCTTASAQTSAQGSRSCRQLQDPAERLRCYDAQDAAANPAPASPAPAAQPTVPSAPATAIAVAPPSAAPAAPVAAPPGAKFGEETLPIKARPAPKAADNVLVATIRSVQEVRPKVFNIALANGQIWRQEGTTATVFFRAGADARIEKGLFGDYRMSTSTTGNGLWVRVTRIQ